AVAGKQPGLTGRHPALVARNAPPFVQYLEQDGRENDVPILLALALLDADDHPVTIDIGELERYDLRGSQAGGISQAQDRPMLDVRRHNGLKAPPTLRSPLQPERRVPPTACVPCKNLGDAVSNQPGSR